MLSQLDLAPNCTYADLMNKERLDILLHQRGLVESRELARRVVMAGEVLVDGRVIDKPGTRVPAGAHIRVKAVPRYVSRGGLKLQAALGAFAVEVQHAVTADIGASTGGFTDCLLQHGARHVYAIDVGYGQLAWRLRQDPRVIVMERLNARYLTALPEPIDLITVDVSFISLKLVLPAAKRLLAPTGQVVALIKPQFEAGRRHVQKGGVVRDPAVHRRVVSDILSWALENGFAVKGLIRSPLHGPAGNVEFLVHLALASGQAATTVDEALGMCFPSPAPEAT